MAAPEELRARASRLFTLALNARELGIEAYAPALAKLGKYVSAQAEALERRRKELAEKATTAQRQK
jgi:hypothetical protein